MRIFVTEFAESKKEIERELKPKTENIIEHLFKLYLVPEHTAVNHWKQEIYSFLHTIDKLKGSNKRPTKEQIYKWTFGKKEDLFDDDYYTKRYNKINDYMHNSSTYIVNHLVSHNVNTLVIGHNKEWKQDTKMRKDNKQSFIQIPFNDFIQMLTYKCQLKGINVVIQEESYTSKCNFLQQDYIPTFGVDDVLFNPSGKRIKRGLYKSNCGKIINADVNGSYNILRKYLTLQEAWNENIFSDCVEVCSTPAVYTVKI